MMNVDMSQKGANFFHFNYVMADDRGGLGTALAACLVSNIRRHTLDDNLIGEDSFFDTTNFVSTDSLPGSSTSRISEMSYKDTTSKRYFKGSMTSSIGSAAQRRTLSKHSLSLVDAKSPSADKLRKSNYELKVIKPPEKHETHRSSTSEPTLDALRQLHASKIEVKKRKSGISRGSSTPTVTKHYSETSSRASDSFKKGSSSETVSKASVTSGKSFVKSNSAKALTSSKRRDVPSASIHSTRLADMTSMRSVPSTSNSLTMLRKTKEEENRRMSAASGSSMKRMGEGGYGASRLSSKSSVNRTSKISSTMKTSIVSHQTGKQRRSASKNEDDIKRRPNTNKLPNESTTSLLGKDIDKKAEYLRRSIASSEAIARKTSASSSRTSVSDTVRGRSGMTREPSKMSVSRNNKMQSISSTQLKPAQSIVIRKSTDTKNFSNTRSSLKSLKNYDATALGLSKQNNGKQTNSQINIRGDGIHAKSDIVRNSAKLSVSLRSQSSPTVSTANKIPPNQELMKQRESSDAKKGEARTTTRSSNLIEHTPKSSRPSATNSAKPIASKLSVTHGYGKVPVTGEKPETIHEVPKTSVSQLNRTQSSPSIITSKKQTGKQEKKDEKEFQSKQRMSSSKKTADPKTLKESPSSSIDSATDLVEKGKQPNVKQLPSGINIAKQTEVKSTGDNTVGKTEKKNESKDGSPSVKKSDGGKKKSITKNTTGRKDSPSGSLTSTSDLKEKDKLPETTHAPTRMSMGKQTEVKSSEENADKTEKKDESKNGSHNVKKSDGTKKKSISKNTTGRKDSPSGSLTSTTDLKEKDKLRETTHAPTRMSMGKQTEVKSQGENAIVSDKTEKKNESKDGPLIEKKSDGAKKKSITKNTKDKKDSPSGSLVSSKDLTEINKLPDTAGVGSRMSVAKQAEIKPPGDKKVGSSKTEKKDIQKNENIKKADGAKKKTMGNCTKPQKGFSPESIDSPMCLNEKELPMETQVPATMDAAKHTEVKAPPDNTIGGIKTEIPKGGRPLVKKQDGGKKKSLESNSKDGKNSPSASVDSTTKEKVDVPGSERKSSRKSLDKYTRNRKSKSSGSEGLTTIMFVNDQMPESSTSKSNIAIAHSAVIHSTNDTPSYDSELENYSQIQTLSNEKTKDDNNKISEENGKIREISSISSHVASANESKSTQLKSQSKTIQNKSPGEKNKNKSQLDSMRTSEKDAIDERKAKVSVGDKRSKACRERDKQLRGVNTTM